MKYPTHGPFAVADAILVSRPARNMARRLVLLATGLATACGAHAVEVDTGNPDLKVKWDTALKYSSAWRLRERNPNLIGPANANYDDGDQNFGRGVISSRVDLFSEADAVWGNFGARVSGAAWYDAVYNRSNDNPGFAGEAYPNQHGAYNRFPEETARLHGRDAELLDAFVFGKGDVGDMRWSGRLGRHSLLWGESLFFGTNAIAGGMMPVDVVKLVSVPNAQFKEAIRPVPQISGQLQVTPDVAVGAYYQFRWQRTLTPAVGSYFSDADVAIAGAQQLLLAPPVTWQRGGDVEPPKHGQGGFQLRWRAGETDLGFYAIRFHEKTPQLIPNLALRGTPPAVFVAPVDYRLVYHGGVRVYGFSASHTVGIANLALEASLRRNQDLASTQGANAAALGGSPLGYAVGNTAHVNVSTIITMPATPLWNEATLVGELAWNRVLSVTQNAAALDPNATRDATALQVQIEPVYRQVMPGLDLSVPLGLGYGFKGSRSMALGPKAMPNDGTGFISLGVSGSWQDVWRFSLNYTHYFGSAGALQALPAGAATPVYTYKQTLADRDFLALSVRRTF